MNALLIASLVLREASRRRLLLVAGLLTLALVVATAWGFNKLATFHNYEGHALPHYAVVTAASVLVLMMAFMFSVILSFAAAFLGALSTGSEIENGTILAIVPRPISRAEIFAGKWMGNAALLVTYAIVIAGAEFTVVRLTTGYVPPHPSLAIAYLVADALLVLTLTMSLSVRISAVAAGFLVIVLFAITRIAGLVGAVATAFHNVPLQNATAALNLAVPTDGVWRAAAFALEPAAMVATSSAVQGNPFVATAPPTPTYLFWCAGWLIVVFCAGARAFLARDL